MSISQNLLQELGQEMTTTRKVLERIPTDLFDWKPHERSFSTGELANHISRLLLWGRETMVTESLDLDPPDGELAMPPVAGSSEALLSSFDEYLAGFQAVLADSDDAAHQVPWTLLLRGEAAFTLPRVAVIRTMIMNHLIHHRGQLSVYLRLNDIPVPSIYGPSADEQV